MAANQYDSWCQYYDPNGIEMEEIKKCAQKNCDKNSLWDNTRILEIGCGTGRFTKLMLKEKVKWIDAIDPSEERVASLNAYLARNNINNRCCAVVTTIEDFQSDGEYDIIVFSWSWAFIGDRYEEILYESRQNKKDRLIADSRIQKENAIKKSLKLLKPNGIIISTMVENGEFEKIRGKLYYGTEHSCRELDRNIEANETLRSIISSKKSILKNRQYSISETKIETAFVFKTIDIAQQAISLSLPNFDKITDNDILNCLAGFKKSWTEKIELSDIVCCICIKPTHN